MALSYTAYVLVAVDNNLMTRDIFLVRSPSTVLLIPASDIYFLLASFRIFRISGTWRQTACLLMVARFIFVRQDKCQLVEYPREIWLCSIKQRVYALSLLQICGSALSNLECIFIVGHIPHFNTEIQRGEPISQEISAVDKVLSCISSASMSVAL